MSTKIDIKMWFSRIQRMEDLQAEKSEERKTALKLYTGTFFGNPLNNSSDLTEVNFVYEFLKILVGSIYARNPKIFVRALRATKWVAFAETMEKVINYYWRELKLKQKVKLAILDGVLQPPGWIGIGYTLLTELKEIERAIPELREKSGKPEAKQGIMDETIKEDDVFADYISSWNVLWPKGYNNIRSAPYLGIKETIPLPELLANPSYKDSKRNIFRSNIISDTVQKVKNYTFKSPPPPTGLNSVSQLDDELTLVTLYHIWDKRSQKRFTLAKNFTADTLFEKKWNYFIEGFPYYPLIFNPIPRTDEKANSYPLSDITPMIPQLKELSYLSSAINRHRKRSGTLILAKKSAMGETDLTKIQNASDIDIIELPEIDESALKGFTPPALPRDFYMMRDIILQDLMRISGFNQLLYSAKGVETATESENVRAGSLIRQSEKVDIIEDFTVDIARGLMGLIWQFIQDKQRIAEIVGEEVNEEMWPSIPDDEAQARKIIQKELQLTIDAGSTRPPKDEAVERKQWMDSAAVLKATYPDAINNSEMAMQVAKKTGFKDLERLIKTNDEEEIRIAQEENKLLMQGIPQLVSPNEKHSLHLQVHAQVYQTPGLNPTNEMNDHILRHHTFEQQQNPQVYPQKGDSKISPPSTSPETRRQGVPEGIDFLGAVNNIPGLGGNQGGR